MTFKTYKVTDGRRKWRVTSVNDISFGGKLKGEMMAEVDASKPHDTEALFWEAMNLLKQYQQSPAYTRPATVQQVPEYKSRPILPAKPSRANDHLTLSDAHRLLSVLRDETQSRAVHAECEDVMARLSKIVEG